MGGRSQIGAMLTISLACAVATPVGAQTAWSNSPAVGLGPLLLRSQSPFSLLRLTPTPLPPDTISAGEWATGGLINWNNYFAVDPEHYTIDVETLTLTLGAAVGLGSDVDLAVTLPVSYRGGGALDGFVEGFEGLVNATNAERTLYPRDRLLIRFRGANQQVFERSGDAAGWGLEDATLTLRHQISRGNESKPAVLVAALLKLPTGPEASLRSTGGVDYGLGASFGEKLGRFHLYGSASVMRYGAFDIEGIQFKQVQWSAFLGLEFRRTRRTSFDLQAMVTSPVVDHEFGGFSKSSFEVTIGLKHVLSDRLMIEAAILENILIYNNSPDVGFFTGLVWRPAMTGSR